MQRFAGKVRLVCVWGKKSMIFQDRRTAFLLWRRAWLMLGLALLLPLSAQAASFDCGKAKTEVEKLICGDTELSRIDEEVAREYKNALARSECTVEAAPEYYDRAQMQCWGAHISRDEQFRWLKQRNACGKDIACLKKAHKMRIVELTRDLIDNHSGWWMRQGVGNDLCEALWRRLIEYRQEELCLYDTTDLALSLPGMKEAEGWRELNPLEHVELINKLRLYEIMNSPNMYFERWNGWNNTITDPGYARNLKKKAQEIKAWFRPYSREDVANLMRNEKLRLRTQVLSVFRYRPWPWHPPIPLESQTLLEFRIAREKSHLPQGGTCSFPQKSAEGTYIYFVTPDFSELDPDVFGRGDGLLVDYKGIRYFMKPHYSGLKFEGRRDDGGSFETICEIEWQDVEGKNRWPELNRRQSR